jgi:hypothetical protein
VEDEVESLRARWQTVFDRLPLLQGATAEERALFVVNIDTPSPVPIGGLKFRVSGSLKEVCSVYAESLRAAGFAVPGPPSERFIFTGYGLPWVFSARNEPPGVFVNIHTDAVDRPGAPPIGPPPAL